ncbi:MAG: cysteine desulfurase [Bacteroidales bacterium]|jgi:cysteine desulfurase/selenocysteine lyase|nr:cysteine desulfurase [Bacteroidales bacterium]
MVHDKPLVYFDNAATTHKPREVIDRLVTYYKKENCNIHRGVHYLSSQGTEAYENARKSIGEFLHAAHSHEIVFTKGATEAVNLVAQSYGRKFIHSGDEIILSEMEHHSNLVPWQMIAEQKGAILKVIPVDEQGELEINTLRGMITDRTKLIALAHVSNVLGTINPVHRVISLAHDHGIPVLLDGAQAVPHLDVDVQELNCDFYCFSAHKVYGPMGIGVLYAKEKYLEEMPPYQGGGEMIEQVSFQKTTYNKLPFKFEAGTPNVAGVLGLEAALKYIQDLDLKKIHAYERELLDYATVELLKMENIRIFGNAENKTAVISFNIGKIHPYDAGTIYDKLGIAVRTGHHCAQPLIERYQVPGMIRASLALYNTLEEIDRFIEGTKQVRRMLG